MKQRDFFFLFLGFTIGSIISFGIAFLPSFTKTTIHKSHNHPVHAEMCPVDKKPDHNTMAQKQLEKFKTDLQQNPKNHEIMLKIANACFELGQYQEAIAYCEQALTIEPKNPDIITNYGMVLKKVGKPEEALLQFEKAYSLDPKHWQALHNKIIIKISKKTDPIDIRNEYETLATIAPQNSAIPLGIAMQYYSASNLMEALYYFEKTLQIEPENLGALNYSAKIYEVSSQKEKAATMYERLLKVLPKNHQNNMIINKIKQLRASMDLEPK